MKKSVCVVVVFLFAAGAGLAQSLNIISPAGGETWRIGGTYTIKWTASGTTHPTVKVMLWQGSTFVMNIEEVQPIIASCGWIIPATVAPGTYKIRVRVIGEQTLGISKDFTIEAPPPVRQMPRVPLERKDVFIKLPALAISDVNLGANNEEFVITFGYKNSGSAPLPKGSEMPEKPNFRVLIDGHEANRGNLFIPETPAPPGWNVPAFHGCVIKFQTGQEFNPNWTAGNTLAVKINENRVNGMESDSETYNLKPMALNWSYDVILTGVVLDWAKETLTLSARIDGDFSGLRYIRFYNNTSDSPFISGFGGFTDANDIVPGQRFYSYVKKLSGVRQNWSEYKSYAGVFLAKESRGLPDFRDIEHRNNYRNETFKRPVN